MKLEVYGFHIFHSTLLGCATACHMSAKCFSFNFCQGSVCQLNTGTRFHEEGSLKFVRSEDCIYSGYLNFPSCLDGDKSEGTCRIPWNDLAEWGEWYRAPAPNNTPGGGPTPSNPRYL